MGKRRKNSWGGWRSRRQKRKKRKKREGKGRVDKWEDGESERRREEEEESLAPRFDTLSLGVTGCH